MVRQFWNEHYLGIIIICLALYFGKNILINTGKKIKDKIPGSGSILGKFWKWIKDNLSIILGVAVCHGLMFFSQSISENLSWVKDWYMLMARNKVFWLDHIVIFVVLKWMSKKGKISGFGSAVLLLLLIFNGNEIWRWWRSGRENYLRQKDAYEKSLTPRLTGSEMMPCNADDSNLNKIKVITLLRKEGLNEDEVEKFMKIAERESCFNQFDSKGEPYHQVPDKDGKCHKQNGEEDDCSSVGVFQIKETLHYEKAIELKKKNEKEYDPRTLKGNVKYAVWLYRNYGWSPWKASTDKFVAKEEQKTEKIKDWEEKEETSKPSQENNNSLFEVKIGKGKIEAPANIWSVLIPVNKRRFSYKLHGGCVIIRTNVEEITDCPGGQITIHYFDLIQFKSISENPVIVEYDIR